MTKQNPLLAPWRKGDGLSCTVFDVRGGVVASIFAPTHEEQTRRMHLVKAAPKMLAAIKTLYDAVKDDNPTVAAALQSVIEEAEPV